MRPKTIEWTGKKMRIVDQTRLPERLVYLDCSTPQQVWRAIRRLEVRGAPAIGIAAAMGIVLGARRSRAVRYKNFMKELRGIAQYLGSARPTAVNLFWALKRMMGVAEREKIDDIPLLKERLEREALKILEEDNIVCSAIGQHGAPLLKSGSTVLTHCNAGGLATAEYGTALSVVFAAHEQGKKIHVFVDETRPLLQGARLTAWELMNQGIPATLICDNMAATVMAEGRVSIVVTGADRIAANGDTANKIGTYGLARLAAAHRIPFYIAAPLSTVDLEISSGKEIPIEQRDPDEVRKIGDRQIAPRGVDVYNPAFDVTPAQFIKGIITEAGIIRPPYRRNIAKAFGKKRIQLRKTGSAAGKPKN
ncbi:MAG: S-methyl-5-thioribose-1-phosphate isomerase [Candidatus Aureabacteria bacterium]|nr:S-methyl-5-thioribose-1-phosphate isomerase [Candidatus Auribacterota bacterium]